MNVTLISFYNRFKEYSTKYVKFMNRKNNADLEKLRLALAKRITTLAKENPNLLITLNSNNYIDIDNVIFDYDNNDYKEFSKTLANVLKYIDFSNISFFGFN